MAGDNVAVNVIAYDAFGNWATGYSGTVHFISTDPQVVLPDAAVLWDSNYVVAFKTAGAQSITVTDVVNSSITGTSQNVTIIPAAPISLVLTGFPATTAGTPQTFTVLAQDPYGNVNTGYMGTVHFTSTDPQAVLPADVAFAGASSRTFTATLRTAGTQSITVADALNSTFASSQAGIAVAPAAAASFSLSNFPATTAGVTQTVTVTAKDIYGNLATGYTGTVTVSSSDLQAGLPGSYSFTASDAGIHNFNVTLKTAGTQSIGVTDAQNSTVTGGESNIVVTSAATGRVQGSGFACEGGPRGIPYRHGHRRVRQHHSQLRRHHRFYQQRRPGRAAWFLYFHERSDRDRRQGNNYDDSGGRRSAHLQCDSQDAGCAVSHGYRCRESDDDRHWLDFGVTGNGGLVRRHRFPGDYGRRCADLYRGGQG